jgi:hypothetical protein
MAFDQLEIKSYSRVPMPDVMILTSDHGKYITIEGHDYVFQYKAQLSDLWYYKYTGLSYYRNQGL